MRRGFCGEFLRWDGGVFDFFDFLDFPIFRFFGFSVFRFFGGGWIGLDFGQPSDSLRTAFGQPSGSLRAAFGQPSGSLRAAFGQDTGSLRAGYVTATLGTHQKKQTELVVPSVIKGCVRGGLSDFCVEPGLEEGGLLLTGEV